MSREIGVAIGLIEGGAIVALGVLIWKLHFVHLGNAMTMTPTDASERERLIASLLDSALEKANDYDCESNVFDEEKAADMLRADAEKIRALEAGRIEAQHVAQHLSLWRGRAATSRTWDRGEEVDLLGALLDKLDAALAAPQPPRSEAGEKSGNCPHGYPQTVRCTRCGE